MFPSLSWISTLPDEAAADQCILPSNLESTPTLWPEALQESLNKDLVDPAPSGSVCSVTERLPALGFKPTWSWPNVSML